jgi:hypothetical protein
LPRVILLGELDAAGRHHTRFDKRKQPVVTERMSRGAQAAKTNLRAVTKALQVFGEIEDRRNILE